MTYFLYTIQAYEHMDVGTGNMRDVIYIRLVGDTAYEADSMLEKAKKMVSKVGYRVADISEFFRQDNHHGSNTR